MTLNLPISISELSRKMKSVMENEFRFIFVTGEISNFKRHTSGHFYFTLKDDKAQVSASMWSSRNQELTFTPDNGMKVIVKGKITLYESKGSYQIDVFVMQPAGVGELQQTFENLKQKLFSEGLFDESIKKKIPEYPERVGIITSESGAALQDFLRVTQKRFPIVKLFLFNANMQGVGSSGNVVSAIRKANNEIYNLDLIVITRGGGSIEDLWSFNEEKVAREVFNSQLPVVSAIGHEIDFTICDFVADLRAPTPSSAAEMIFPDIVELEKRILEYSFDLKNLVTSRISYLKNRLDQSSGNYYFRRVADKLNEYKFRLDELDKDILRNISDRFFEHKRNLDSIEKLLNSFSPEQVLKRGYAIIKRDEKIIGRNKLKPKDNIEIKFYDGESKAVVTE